MLEMKNVCVGYGKNTVLQNVSLTFSKGVFTAVIGKNGCGKSTLLKTALGILTPISGDVLLDGVSLGRMKRKAVAARLSYLAQQRQLADMTVEQTVLHGRFPYLHYPYRYGARDRAVALAAMEKMDLQKLAQTPLGELSGGMRQKVYIAMALAQSTDHIFLDEPTAYLDAGVSLALMRDLRALVSEGKTVVAVMHDLSLALECADRILVPDGGGILFDGTPDALLKTDVAERVFGVSLAAAVVDGKKYYRLEEK